jgi:hypothetical protein
MRSARHHGEPWRLWTKGELVEWRLFFSGRRAEPPADRTIDAARRKLKAYQLRGLSMVQRHAMATAAAKYLPQVPYRGPLTHTYFIEDAEKIAVLPEAFARREWPAEAFRAAVMDARKALYCVVDNPGTQAVDTPHASR